MILNEAQGDMTKVIGAFTVYKFIKLMATPFRQMDAYKFGIIDSKGKFLKKSEDLIQRIDFLDSREDRTSALRKTKDKIGKMRRAGLEREGEYSVENLVFKTLRNTGYLEKLNVIIKNDYDHSVSLDQ